MMVCIALPAGLYSVQDPLLSARGLQSPSSSQVVRVRAVFRWYFTLPVITPPPCKIHLLANCQHYHAFGTNHKMLRYAIVV